LLFDKKKAKIDKRLIQVKKNKKILFIYDINSDHD